MTTLLIAGNAIFAILCAVFFVQYSKIKKSSTAEIEELKNKIDEEMKEISMAEDQMRNNIMADNKKIESLLQEVAAAKKEKEDELKLRMETEKEIAIANQKVDDIQKRMLDWKMAQESAMHDAQDAIFEIGENLYERISAAIHEETKNIHNFLEQIHNKQISTPTKPTQPDNISHVAAKQEPQPQKQAESSENKPSTTQDISKKMASDLVKSMQDAGHQAGKKYFTANDFDTNSAKLFLCETAFLHDSYLYFFDFKSCNFFDEYNKAEDKETAEKILAQKLGKYVSYLGNEKYQNALSKSVQSKNLTFDNGDIVAIVPSHADLDLMDRIGYLEKIESVGAKVATFDEVIDLTL